MSKLQYVYPGDLVAASSFVNPITAEDFSAMHACALKLGLTETNSIDEFRVELKMPLLCTSEEYAAFKLEHLRRIIKGPAPLLVLENPEIDSTGILLLGELIELQMRSNETFIRYAINSPAELATTSLSQRAEEATQIMVQELEERYDERYLRQIRRSLPISGVRIDWASM